MGPQGHGPVWGMGAGQSIGPVPVEVAGPAHACQAGLCSTFCRCLLWEPSPSPDTLPWLAFKDLSQAHLLHPVNNPFLAVCSSRIGE